VHDLREFNIQFSKIDLEFLAFRKAHPLKLESISIINTTLLEKKNAASVFTEVVMYARRHCVDIQAIMRQFNPNIHVGLDD